MTHAELKRSVMMARLTEELDRLQARGFNGRVEIHIGDGLPNALHVVERTIIQARELKR